MTPLRILWYRTVVNHYRLTLALSSALAGLIVAGIGGAVGASIWPVFLACFTMGLVLGVAFPERSEAVRRLASLRRTCQVREP